MRRSLGKGLTQLIGEQSDSSVAEIELGAIQPNSRQPRTVFDEDALDELAASIKQVGILQPIVVRPIAEGRYELIAGERRWRAAARAGLATIPALIRSATGESSLELALIENVQRENIGALECARAYRQLVDEFRLTQEQVADRVGKSRVAIANTLRLLKLPAEVLRELEAGTISEGHARALLGLTSAVAQIALCRRIVAKGLSVREVEALVSGVTRPKKGTKRERPGPTKDPNWVALEEGLAIYFGSPVHLDAQDSGGKLTIDFYSDDDLQRILDILGIHL
ncbi:MAG TPA: ParB/RepB/Spo0J family partition protein [Fimbriimonadaceae bacterium]|nr:ParB/RepB/Spo0J family partition protein [Fimbriimonadaceae bacterium]